MKVAKTAFPLAAALILTALVSCQTPPKTPTGLPEPGAGSTIEALAPGLAPSGDEQHKAIGFAVAIGNKESASGWALAIAGQDSKVVYTQRGDASAIPDKLSWNGRADSGALASEGRYTATLAIDYGTKYASVKVSSKPFILDITPPTASFKLNPAQFTPAPGGVRGPVTATVDATAGIVPIKSWSIDISDPSGSRIATIGATWPSNQAAWDGKTETGPYVQAATSYPARLKVKDEFGNTGEFAASFPVSDVPKAEPSSIVAGRDRPGFSPTSTTAKNSIDLLLTFGSKDSVDSWKVTVVSAAKGVVRSFSGGKTSLPDFISWDGKTDAGILSDQGQYYATLAIDYAGFYKSVSLRSRSFSLVTTPPTGSVTVDPASVQLAQLSALRPITFTVAAESAYAQIADWRLSVLAPGGAAVAVFNANWPNKTATWDGKTLSGKDLDPSATYQVVATVQDEYGNVGRLTGTLKTEGLAVAQESSSVVARRTGFAPKGDGTAPNVEFGLFAGNASSVKSWRLEIVGSDKATRRTLSGTGSEVPASFTWDGNDDRGALAPEGYYTARLSLDYGQSYAPVTAQSKPVLLDLSPPKGSIELSTKLFAPDGSGPVDTVDITMNAGSAFAKMADWKLDILDPDGKPFAKSSGAWPHNVFTWDGIGSNGDLVESAADYKLVASVRDEYGNVGQLTGSLATDILVFKTDRGYRIRITSIVFKPFTTDYRDVPQDRAARNLTTLDLLTAKLKKFPEYSIRLEGHAVMVNWADRTEGEAEQRVLLIPLSWDRAETIKAALIERGIPASRLSTAGRGANEPVVPDSDYANRWQNRRVDFFLEK